MSEFPNEIVQQHIADISMLKTKVDNMEKVISDLSVMKDTLIEMKLYNKQQLEFNERQAKANEEFTKTLSGMHENLNYLNVEMKDMNTRVHHLENTKEDNTDIKIEETKSKTEIIKQKYIVIGLAISGILSTLAIVIPIILKK